eukprot:g2045.t1
MLFEALMRAVAFGIYVASTVIGKLLEVPPVAYLWSFVTEFITEHRGIFVTVFVLPVSLMFDVFFAVRAWLVMKFYSAPALHEERVRDIVDQIEKWKEDGGTKKLCTARGGWQSISPGYRQYKSYSTQIRVDMYDILEFKQSDDKADGAPTIRVEPMVNMGQISHYIIPKGYTLPVLPELDDLTVGGLYMGVGIETTSHIHGLFNDTVVEAEVVLADGSVVTCSETENTELYDALPWSYGTLGFLTSVTIKLVPCKPFVRIEYFPCQTREQGEALLRKYSEKPNPPAFVEALAYSLDKMVVMPAEFADASEVPWVQRNSIGLWYKPWFYKHVESMLTLTERRVEYIPLRDYYHRHTKSIFWELEQIIPWGNNPVFRFLLGWAIPPKVSFLKLTSTGKLKELYEKSHVIQDMLVPMSKFSESMKVFDDNYDLWPLWICPYRAYDYSTGRAGKHRCFLRKPKNASAKAEDGRCYEMYVDLGAYGIPRAVQEKREFDIVSVSQKVENYVASVHGFQMLYADSYLSRDEFRAMFDHSHYDSMKRRYDPTGAFPEVYEKVCKKAMSLWKKKDL